MKLYKNIFEWMRPLVDDVTYDLFLHHVKQNSVGRFTLKKTKRARRKTHLSLRQLQKRVRQLEDYAIWYEIYLIFLDEDLWI